MRFTIPILLLLIAQAGAVPPEDAVLVPAGEFVMGSDEGNADEGPPHRVRVSAYYIDRDEVTNAEFTEFVRESGSFDEIEGTWLRYYAPGCEGLIAHYENRYGVSLEGLDPDGKQAPEDVLRWRSAVAALQAMPEGDHSNFPVRGVTWRDAAAFATWAGKRLPTEAE